MPKIVLGGGLGGLSATYYLQKVFPKEAVTLVESSNRTGGWIKSSPQENGTVFEQGPRTIRPRGEAAATTLQLVEDLGLDNKIVYIPSNHPAAINRMVYVNGKLHSLPSSLSGIFKTQSPFSKPLIRHLMNDLIAPRKLAVDGDESIYDFINRRFGTEIADYLISPMICGICAGNAKEISVKFLLKSFFENEQKYGSVSRGMLFNMLTKKGTKVQEKSNLEKRAKIERWSIYSFQNGLETLTKSLNNNIVEKGADIKLNSSCMGIELNDNNAIVHLNNGKKLECDHLISSLPAVELGKLINNKHTQLSQLLKSIQYVNVAVVNIQFNKKLISNPGFGFLIAPKENLPILGVIYDSCCFPKGDSTLLTVMMGGYWFEKHFGKNPSEVHLLDVALKETRKILNFTDNPIKHKVSILKNCIPQYVVGHEKKINEINNYIKTNDLPISLCGSSYYGVGVNDVVLSAKTVVNNLSK